MDYTKYIIASLSVLLLCICELYSHGTCISPASRVYRIFQSNIENPNFQLARNATNIDNKNSYYTWNEVSRNIPEAVVAGLPPGFDYSSWIPDGQIASGGRVDPNLFGTTYGGMDQVSADWPTTDVEGGQTLEIDFLATAVHNPSVWDVWMTTPDWDPNMPLTWNKMEFLDRPTAALQGTNYSFDVNIPSNRTGHHVLWIAWHRDDPVGEVFFSTSDLMIIPVDDPEATCNEVANGDFEINTASWSNWNTDIALNGGGLQITNISTPNSSPDDAGIRQNGVTLSSGTEYVLEYQANAIAQRNLQVKITDDKGTTVFEQSEITINPTNTTYAFTFINNKPTTDNAVIEIYCGGSIVSINLDNISLLESSCVTRCYDQLELTSIDRSTYKASDRISCSAAISESANIGLKAGLALELIPSFEIPLGSIMDLSIEDCID